MRVRAQEGERTRERERVCARGEKARERGESAREGGRARARDRTRGTERELGGWVLGRKRVRAGGGVGRRESESLVHRRLHEPRTQMGQDKNELDNWVKTKTTWTVGQLD